MSLAFPNTKVQVNDKEIKMDDIDEAINYPIFSFSRRYGSKIRILLK